MTINKLFRLFIGGIVFLLGCYLSVLEIGITYSEWGTLHSSSNKIGSFVGISIVVLLGFGIAYGGIRIMKGSK